MQKKATFDIALIGGGITGLWALNRLSQRGLNCALFESNALGSGQTLHSQGIIHGGIKYALTGLLTNSSSQIANMPHRWKACLENQGEIDLSSVNILSRDQLLWSTGGLTSDLTTFFASKALKSRIQSLSRHQYPVVLQDPSFKGRVYRLEEIVLDVPSLIQCLARPHQDRLFKIDPENGCSVRYHQSHPLQDGNFIKNKTIKQIQSLDIKNGSDTLEVSAKHFIFTAGEGNAKLLQDQIAAPEMQCRPLHMVMVRLPVSLPFYAHCLDNGVNPRMTITSHMSREGKCIWYLGGQIAEEGLKRTTQEQIAFANQELKSLFPGLNLNGATFSSFFINRAEVKAKDGKRPDSFFLETLGNSTVIWPTKLALTPLLVDTLIDSLEKKGINNTPHQHTLMHKEVHDWEKPSLGLPPWEKMEFSSHE